MENARTTSSSKLSYSKKPACAKTSTVEVCVKMEEAFWLPSEYLCFQPRVKRRFHNAFQWPKLVKDPVISVTCNTTLFVCPSKQDLMVTV